MPTKQETFDIVVRHLLKQGDRSINSDQLCCYRGPYEMKCAVGCLIPDERYKYSMEGEGLLHTHNRQLNEVGLLMEELGHDTDLCDDLQYIHDQEPVGEWEDELRKLAEQKYLNFPEIN